LSPSGRTFISKDFLFNESRFPYLSLFQNYTYDPLHPIQDVSLSSLPIQHSDFPPSLQNQLTPPTSHVPSSTSATVTESPSSSSSQQILPTAAP